MYKMIFILFPFLSIASSTYDFSVFEKKNSIENKQAAENKKIKCRLVCDKKIYKEQKISEAIEFYKNSKDYFNKSK